MWATLLAALPKLLQLVMAIVDLAKNTKLEQQGINDAVAKILQKAMDEIKLAAQVEAQADADHKAHPTDDTGFDPDFRRD